MYSDKAKEFATNLVIKLSSTLNLKEKLDQLPSSDFRRSDIFLIIGDLDKNLEISANINKFKQEVNLDTINNQEAASNLRALIAAENPTQQLEQ